MSIVEVFSKKEIDLHIEEQAGWSLFRANQKLCDKQFRRSLFLVIIMSIFTAFAAVLIWLFYMREHSFHKTDTLIAISDDCIIGYHAGFHRNEILSIQISEILEVYDKGFGYLSIKTKDNVLYTMKNKLLTENDRDKIIQFIQKRLG